MRGILVQVQLMPVQLRPRSGIRTAVASGKLLGMNLEHFLINQVATSALREQDNCTKREPHTAEWWLTRDHPCHPHHGCNIIEAASALGAPPIRFAQVNALICSYTRA